MTDRASPAISIILVIGSQRVRAGEALSSILAQDRIDETEVIVVDVAAGDHSPIAGSDHHVVRVIGASRADHIGRLRAGAARIARAPLIGFVEEHVAAMPGWLDAILTAFERGPWSVVGPAVRLDDDEPALSTALAAVAYGPWLTPFAVTAEVATVIGHNCAYRRQDLLALGLELDELLLAEQVMHARLVERGARILLCADAVIYHRNESTVATMMLDYFYWSVSFGRLRRLRWGRRRRFLRIAATPVTPFVRTWRAWPVLSRHASGRRLAQAGVFAFLCAVAQAAGLLVGYLGGYGDVALRLSRMELETPHRQAFPAAVS